MKSRSKQLLPLALALLILPAFAQQKPADKWDVNDDLGPTTKLSFDTSEGTWMNVDVSPDGKQIVFDLLGDIYIMPIGGSDQSREPDCGGRRLRYAAAVQPRWQADRVHIRPRWALEHLDDGPGWEEPEADFTR